MKRIKRLTITGDTTHSNLGLLINESIERYGNGVRFIFSPLLRFEEHNDDIKKSLALQLEEMTELKSKIKEYKDKLKEIQNIISKSEDGDEK